MENFITGECTEQTSWKKFLAVSITLRRVASNVICQHVKLLLYQCLSDDIIVQKYALDISIPVVAEKLLNYVSFRTEFGMPMIFIWSLLVNDTRSHMLECCQKERGYKVDIWLVSFSPRHIRNKTTLLLLSKERGSFCCCRISWGGHTCTDILRRIYAEK